MARKNEELIELPAGMGAEVSGMEVKLKSGKGEISRNFKMANLSLSKEGNSIKILGINEMRKTRALVKTIKAHIKNMIGGLENGHEAKLAIVYSHFPLNVQQKGTNIEILNYLGEKKPRIAKVVGKAKVEIKGKEITVSGIDIEAVGQTAANIEKATKVKGKDRRIFQDGIFVQKK